MSSAWSRVVVGAALLPAVLGVVWLGGWTLFALAIVAGLVALHELFTLARTHRPLVLAGFGGLVLALLGAQLGSSEWLLGGLLAGVALTFVLYGISAARPSAVVAFGATVLGLVWIGAGLGLLLRLRDIPEHGRLAVFTVLLVIFADSTAAYFVGRAIGRHRLAPQISPGKSWEGFVAGAIAAVLVCFFALYEQDFLGIWQALVLGAVLALSEVLGDLFESAVKRDLGVKDSGRLLAGHGGMLDRLDSLLWAGPAAYFVVLAFQ